MPAVGLLLRGGLPGGGGRESVETGQYLAPCITSPKRKETVQRLKSRRHINQMDRAAHYGSRLVGKGIYCGYTQATKQATDVLGPRGEGELRSL